MGLSREEIMIKLGVDGRSVAPGLNRVKQTVVSIGAETVKELTGRMKKLLDAFTFMGMIQGIRNVAREFDALKDKPDELEAAFGKLSGTQQEALENMNVGLIDYSKKATVFLLGGLQGVMNIFATMIAERKGFSAALNDVVDEDLAKMKEMEKAAEEMRAAKIWEKEKAALLEFKRVQEQIAFKRMTPQQQIDFLTSKNKELVAQSEHAAAAGDEPGKYKFATEVLQNEDQIQTIRDKMAADAKPGGPHTDGPLDPAPELRDKTSKPIAEYYQKVANQRRNYAASLSNFNPTLNAEANKYEGMAKAFYKVQAEFQGVAVQPVYIVGISDNGAGAPSTKGK